jgi:hypothetical protein
MPWRRNWHALAGALTVSCVGIIVRSGYRCAEFAQGPRGHLATSEGFFYGLDTLPLFVAIAVYVFFWPGRFIPYMPAGELVQKTSQETLPLQVRPGTARPW